MKKFILKLILIPFFINANAQDSLLKWETYSDSCIIHNKVKFWVDVTVPDSSINSFWIPGIGSNSTGDTIYGTLPYNGLRTSAYVSFKHNSNYNNIQKHFIEISDRNSQITVDKGLIDSTLQVAKTKLSFVDSNAIIDSLIVKQIKIANPNGMLQDDVLNTYSLKEQNGKIDFSDSSIQTLGKYRIYQRTVLKDGCKFENNYEQTIGHFNSIRIDTEGYIYDSIYYFHSGGNLFCNIINWWENTSCIDSNGYFYNPDSNTARTNWLEYGKNKGYKLPEIKETIRYDFNSDGIIDSTRQINEKVNWDSNSVRNAIRIPEQFQQDTLTVWSRDSLGQWQSSNPIPYTNCSRFSRDDKFVLENDDSLVFYHAAQRPIGYSKFTTVLYHQTFVGNDTSYTPYDTIEYHWLEQIKVATRFGYNLIKTWSNNTVCDEPKFDTVYSCIGFRRSAEFKVEGDSVILNNTSFEGYHDSVLLDIRNEKNELVDSVWVSKNDYYVKALSNGSYTAFIKSNSPCDSFEAIRFEITTSALANLMSSKIDIFPNPVTSSATVLFNYSKGNYSIVDLTGRTVSKGVLTKGNNEITLTNIPKGVYLIEISQNGSVFRTRLVKE